MNYPCLVVSPQSSGRGWNADVLAALLDELVAKYRVDTERIYLTGLSMGDSGTWSLAAAYSDQEKSGLQIESQPGRNEYIFELRD